MKLETKDNKYLKGYWFICERAKTRELPDEIYTEKHHIYPTSIYGENKELVKLTAKEHFLAHYMLWKGLKEKYGTSYYQTVKMAGAFNYMSRYIKGSKRYVVTSSKLYEQLRIAASEVSKYSNIGHAQTEEDRHKKSISMKLFYSTNGVSAERLALLRKNCNNKKGVKHTLEHSNNISKALKGLPKSEEHKQKMSNGRIGKNNPNAVKYVFEDPDGKTIEFITSKEVDKFFKGVSHKKS